MGKKVVIFNIALMSVILVNHTVLNISYLPSLIDAEYLVCSTIHVIEDNFEEDNLSVDDDTAYNPTLRKNLSSSLSPYAISGISPSVWQPPE